MLGRGVLRFIQAELRPTDPCVEMGAPSLIGTQTWVLQGDPADTSLHPLPWEGAHGWEAAGLVQGWPGDSFAQPVPGQEWPTEGCHRQLQWYPARVI